MSTRFGGVSKNKQQNQIKVALIVCGLLFVVLIGVFFVLVQSPSQAVQTPSPIVATPVEVAQDNTGDVKVLVARQRIEEGSQISQAMFEPADWNPENIPSGAILEGKLQLMLAQKAYYAAYLIDAKAPLLESSITESQPISPIDIPPGHRAVTINVDNRSSIEGWARPGSRVDILWTYNERDGRKAVKVLVPFAKVLLLGGSAAGGPAAGAAPAPSNTVTLLVTSKQAQKVELARTLGTLSLSLVGEVETGDNLGDGDAVTADSLYDRGGIAPQEEIPADGVMYDTDPVTGKQRKFLLINGRWKLASEQ